MSIGIALPEGPELDEMIGTDRFLAKCEEARTVLKETWDIRNIDRVVAVIDWSEVATKACRKCRATRDVRRLAARLNVDAERQAGKVLLVTIHHEGGRPSKNQDIVSGFSSTTYKDLGIHERIARRWQRLGSVEDDDEFEGMVAEEEAKGELTTGGMLKRIAAKDREVKEEQRVEEQRTIDLDPSIRVENCRFQDADVASDSVDWIITDPPYGLQFEREYQDLSKWSARVLKPGGSVLAMVGQEALPKILNALCSNASMTYQWILAYRLAHGSPYRRLWTRRLYVGWKPVIWLSKGPLAALDFLNPDVNFGTDIIDDPEPDVPNDFYVCAPSERAKKRFRWEQGQGFFDWAVTWFTRNTDVVADPFMGTGTTGISCKKYGRQFLGIEVDAARCAAADERIRRTPVCEHPLTQIFKKTSSFS